MSPPISYAKQTLSYPLFDVEFDPYARGYLVVGGGGGEGRSGVANKISLLDCSSRHEVTVAAEVDLSRDEDSVQSLANLSTKDGLITFAGVNSSIANQQAGKNDHFRTFTVDFPPRRRGDENQDTQEKSTSKITPTARTSLFATSTATKKETYQRLTRLSPVTRRDTPGKRLGAITTGLASENEILLFDATSAAPTSGSVCARILPQQGSDSAEANDLDLSEPRAGTFALAYCTDYEVRLFSLKYDFASKTATPLFPDEPHGRLIYSSPHPDAVEKSSARHKIRCLRWLTNNHLILATNASATNASDSVVLRANPVATGPGYVCLRKRLPSHLKSAVSLDVCPLDTDPATGRRQIIVAVAGQDTSICIYSINHIPGASNPLAQTSKFTNFTTLQDVHASSITKVRFCNFFPPKQPDHSPVSVASHTQYAQLASISISGTVVVDTIALTSVPVRPSDTDEVGERFKTPAVRWVLSSAATERLRTWTGVALVGFGILLVAMIIQSYLDTTFASAISVTNFRSFSPNDAVLAAGQDAIDSAGELINEAVEGVAEHVQPVLDKAESVLDQASAGIADAVHEAVDIASSSASSAVEEAAATVAEAFDPNHPVRNLLTSHLRTQESLSDRQDAPRATLTGAAAIAPHALVIMHTDLAPSLQDPSAASEGSAQEIADGIALDSSAAEQGIKAVLHPISELQDSDEVVRFEDLPEAEQSKWKAKLQELGMWGLHEGDEIFKGVFFSGLSQAVSGLFE